MTTTTDAPGHSPQAAAGSQTLSRGIRALEVLAEAPAPLTIAELADALGVHRSIAYRILRTLEDHGLVVRGESGRIALGPRMAALARGVSRDLQSAALPELTSVANDLAMTVFIAVLDRGEVITLVSVEPRHAHVSVAQRPGTRHALERGAPGHAIQASLSPAERAALAPGTASNDSADGPTLADTLAVVRESGFATSHDEVIPGLSSVAVPLRPAGQAPAALAVVYVGAAASAEQIAARLHTAAAAIVSELG
ncbi:IclR family transcriptional regulator [Glaciibacter psychrotolerans]|uniref:DNA-binding IclR family transcriptional regulator n=1 Tax=Glaciibacter psychrotolerans TaxID=670054 RepID=A0A7Z0EEU0_9MICO|nr:IclR family transcriptional regulator [Leifsonia psychrotolerans]NYJ20349.1 DNA-binding IclR family transcriptional regulator [Leifsonia psychrotolerans]